MIVVDTNVICYRWMPSPYANAADKAWAKEPDWIAPLLWRSEFRKALAGAIRRNLITVEAAIGIVEKAETQFARAVMQLIANSGCSAYDCEFVALASDQGVRLLTVDRQILTDFSDLAVSLDKFVRR